MPPPCHLQPASEPVADLVAQGIQLQRAERCREPRMAEEGAGLRRGHGSSWFSHQELEICILSGLCGGLVTSFTQSLFPHLKGEEVRLDDLYHPVQPGNPAGLPGFCSGGLPSEVCKTLVGVQGRALSRRSFGFAQVWQMQTHRHHSGRQTASCLVSPEVSGEKGKVLREGMARMPLLSFQEFSIVNLTWLMNPN